ncbi:MAG: hypothetical protein A2776_01160 [Candidatus Levybacteria bacterium RIFCSPHIGHO2_01_FULL_40_10]|nr:MAG: hypothetical protein A2776_01160 [Candidatus Levybacteria bacterium RIFCSPHIGHO2_01_FULL_40_10]
MSPEARRTNVNIVRTELRRDPPTPRHEMPDATGLKKREISTVFSYLVRIGELPQPTLRDSRRTMRQSVSKARGGLSLTIEPYARQGMNAIQITDMVYLEQGITLHRDRVSIALAKAKAKWLPERTEGKGQVRRNRVPVEAIEARKINPYVEMLHLRGFDLSDVRAFINGKKREHIHDRKTRVFAKEMLRAGFIDEDLTYWNQIQEIFTKSSRKFKSPAHRIAAEVFLRQRRYMMEGDTRMLDIYSKISQVADPEWLETPDIKEDRRIIMNYRTS